MASDDEVTEGAIACNLRAQLVRANRLPNFAQLFDNCEVALSNPTPQLPLELLERVFRNTEAIDCEAHPDGLYGVRAPTADGSPGLPQSIVFCPDLCELYKMWVLNETAGDVCNLKQRTGSTGSAAGSGS